MGKQKNMKKRENPVKNIIFIFLFLIPYLCLYNMGGQRRLEVIRERIEDIEAKGTRRGLR